MIPLMNLREKIISYKQPLMNYLEDKENPFKKLLSLIMKMKSSLANLILWIIVFRTMEKDLKNYRNKLMNWMQYLESRTKKWLKWLMTFISSEWWRREWGKKSYSENRDRSKWREILGKLRLNLIKLFTLNKNSIGVRTWT